MAGLALILSNSFTLPRVVQEPGPSLLRAPSTEAMVDILADGKQPAAARQFAAMAIGSLGCGSPRHWSSRLAAGIDYRSATPVLVLAPYGVLRLP